LCKNKIKIKVKLLGFEPKTFHDNVLKLKQYKQTRLLHNIHKALFIILYNHYLSKISEIKKLRAKIKISNLRKSSENRQFWW